MAKSAVDDIWRYKAYHLNKRDGLSDVIKRSAYFTKWIVRHRPIFHVRTTGLKVAFDEEDASLFINEIFAFHYLSLNMIAYDLKYKQLMVNAEFASNILYDLHYRRMSGDALIHIYNIIRNGATGESVVERAVNLKGEIVI